MSWTQLIPVVLTLIGLITVLGAPLAFALRARGYAFFIVTVPAAFAVIALSQIISGFLRIPWQPLVPLGLSLLLALLLLPLWKLHRFDPLSVPGAKSTAYKQLPLKNRLHDFWVPLIAAGAAGFFIVSQLLPNMWAPDAISQTYDANFHLNLVDEFLATGSANPFTITLTSPEGPVFYPSLWHGTVALLVQLTGTSIPAATNAMTLVVCCVVWPLGAVGLVRSMLGPSNRAAIIAALSTVPMAAMPYVLAIYGVLYPLLLSMSLLPFVLLALMHCFRAARSRSTDPLSQIARIVLAIGSLGAAALAQPSAIFGALILLGPLFALAIVRAWKAGRYRYLLPLGLALVGYAVAIVLAWKYGSIDDNSWLPRNTVWRAVVDGLSGSPHLGSDAWVVGVLTMVGVVLMLLRKRYRWFAAMYLLLVAVYTVCDGFPVGTLRSLITGPWYNDGWRLAALIGVVAVPVLAFALDNIAVMLLRLKSTVKALWGRRATQAMTAITIVIAGAGLLLNPAIGEVKVWAESSYDNRDGYADLINESEKKLIKQADEILPDGSLLLNNPWTGSSLVKTLSDNEVIFPHIGGNYPQSYFDLINGIRDADPAACQTAQELGAEYIIDFGDHPVFKSPRDFARFAEVTNLKPSENPNLELIASEGDTKLFKIIGCSWQAN
ncbi:DUF6541 family protein [Leucobacter sp. OH1287]|uniref:DUF6541 family protein n=1 Tax=Leucobacter sp. OH1287 TaxID=2491049 RepID=UPI000F5DE905|nr:DUF6541 family protein [Leucobacter sp. OH1287]RRD61142.1 hypothetical protein EII30_03300 [Leucobacter sp. OH1287]